MRRMARGAMKQCFEESGLIMAKIKAWEKGGELWKHEIEKTPWIFTGRALRPLSRRWSMADRAGGRRRESNAENRGQITMQMISCRMVGPFYEKNKATQNQSSNTM